ncbi:hypothetical protein D6C90_03603 [Aureobasidium pullulans]|uniref:GATA-type domain-containing protein n=1 Tax=Aureobasidium pullulans TaxID=5580 RepID=A0A4S8YAJ8_AURPU|nr:hypothetical protein D6D21_01980 [Aureobasidium pullulans]THY49053.1 hypothetical protein D6C99_05266 [Aureobasidium pullulans]THZ48993.1 hypothetical protein D6C90_03603 [Aureobasidium pullulans]TIA61304.1 hypothetical protein D6C83_03112 [Aureobasidium pullulans]TIA74535.1 hypothetical protein D6C76_06293 [Aureobasidium pullulans]
MLVVMGVAATSHTARLLKWQQSPIIHLIQNKDGPAFFLISFHNHNLCHPSPHSSYHRRPLPYTSLIDDIDHPLDPFVITTCRETILDKDFTRFAEAVTRQLFGANADVPHLRELSALSSYNKLRFIRATVPTNHTNVLREGFSYSSSDDPIDIETRAAETRKIQNESKKIYMATTGRYNYVCANCETPEAYSWHLVKGVDDDNGDRICHRCDVYYKTYDEYPTPEEVDRLATRAANLVAMAANPPPPGVCQNGLCGMDGNSNWHWSFAHGFYLCDAC